MGDIEHLIPKSKDLSGKILVKAAQDGRLDIIQALLAGANISDEDRGLAVRSATQRGHLEVVLALLQNGPISKTDRGNAVILAAMANRPEIIRALLADGATILQEDREWLVVTAAKNGHHDVVQELLANSATISEMALGIAVIEAARGGHLEVVRALLPEGANIHEVHRGSAVIGAAPLGRLDIIQALLVNGAISDEDRGRAVYRAAHNGHLEVVQALLANGATISDEDRGTAVLVAAHDGHLEVVLELLENGPIFETDRDRALVALTNRPEAPNAEQIRDALNQARVIVSEQVQNPFQYSINAASQGTLQDALDGWSRVLGENESFPNADVFQFLDETNTKGLKQFLNRLRDTEDFKRATEAGKEDFARRLRDIVECMAEIEEFRDPAVGAISEALSSCSDRVTVGLNRLEMLRRIHGKEKSTTALGKAFLALQIFRHEMLTEKVNKLHTQLVEERPTIVGDWMETMLFAENALRVPLNLPIASRVMSYPALSRIHKRDVPQIEAEIRNLTNSREKIIETLATRCPLWQDHLRQQKPEEYEKIIIDKMNDPAYVAANEDEQKVLLAIAMTEKYKEDTDEFFKTDGSSLQQMLSK
jgi:ankyrin repeat protein